ncbi:hypothetical protein NMY22_g11355 [Coprinellus aureogranulatus]|nr:hypothetical protein NMY22_g11355 [Coprinellus aureogranulatus]
MPVTDTQALGLDRVPSPGLEYVEDEPEAQEAGDAAAVRDPSPFAPGQAEYSTSAVRDHPLPDRQPSEPSPGAGSQSNGFWADNLGPRTNGNIPLGGTTLTPWASFVQQHQARQAPSASENLLPASGQPQPRSSDTTVHQNPMVTPPRPTSHRLQHPASEPHRQPSLRIQNYYERAAVDAVRRAREDLRDVMRGIVGRVSADRRRLARERVELEERLDILTQRIAELEAERRREEYDERDKKRFKRWDRDYDDDDKENVI